MSIFLTQILNSYIMTLFKNTKTYLERIKEFFWPTIGFKRSLHYLILRVLRIKASAYEIASGFSLGVAVSFTPLLGGHCILALGFSWALRGNYAAALLGTLIGTPWTLPFMWYLGYKVEVVIANLIHKAFPNFEISPYLFGVQTFDISAFYKHPADLFWPTLLGSIPVGLIIGGCVFTVTYLGIRSYRTNKAHRKKHHDFRHRK